MSERTVGSIREKRSGGPGGPGGQSGAAAVGASEPPAVTPDSPPSHSEVVVALRAYWPTYRERAIAFAKTASTTRSYSAPGSNSSGDSSA